MLAHYFGECNYIFFYMADNGTNTYKNQLYVMNNTSLLDMANSFFCITNIWCRLGDSNSRPTDYKSVALPTELNRHLLGRVVGVEPTTFRATI